MLTCIVLCLNTVPKIFSDLPVKHSMAFTVIYIGSSGLFDSGSSGPEDKFASFLEFIHLKRRDFELRYRVGLWMRGVVRAATATSLLKNILLQWLHGSGVTAAGLCFLLFCRLRFDSYCCHFF